jgi:hypothetical protein
MKAWHFVGKTLRDGSPIPADGVQLVYHGALKLCESGLHASLHPYDALMYAPGDTLCLVHCAGKIIQDTDKLVCSERTIIARMDATEMLRYFARMQALSVIDHYPNSDDDAVFDYLMTGEGATAARSAADSAYSAADSAYSAVDSAYSAYSARSAAYSAYSAYSAARLAAYSAYSAARLAARSAAYSAARDYLEMLVNESFSDYL